LYQLQQKNEQFVDVRCLKSLRQDEEEAKRKQSRQVAKNNAPPLGRGAERFGEIESSSRRWRIPTSHFQ
jgi:hypothetical protein